MEGKAVDFAVVSVELIKLNGFGVVQVDRVKNCLDVIFRKAGVQPHYHVFEALVAQVAFSLLIICLEGSFQ